MSRLLPKRTKVVLFFVCMCADLALHPFGLVDTVYLVFNFHLAKFHLTLNIFGRDYHSCCGVQGLYFHM